MLSLSPRCKRLPTRKAILARTPRLIPTSAIERAQHATSSSVPPQQEKRRFLPIMGGTDSRPAGWRRALPDGAIDAQLTPRTRHFRLRAFSARAAHTGAARSARRVACRGTRRVDRARARYAAAAAAPARERGTAREGVSVPDLGRA